MIPIRLVGFYARNPRTGPLLEVTTEGLVLGVYDPGTKRLSVSSELIPGQAPIRAQLANLEVWLGPRLAAGMAR